jgi:signal transduction histidine kinase
VYFDIQVNPVRTAQGTISGVLVAARDVTEQVAARRELRRAREVTLHQIQLIDQKMAKMASMREQLAERIRKYDEALLKYTDAGAGSEGTAQGSTAGTQS